MCQTFYLQHQECTCILVLQEYIPCDAVSPHPMAGVSGGNDPTTDSNPFADPQDPFADPQPKEEIPLQADTPKLLTWTITGLDFEYNEFDYVSIDVDQSMAPKSLRCPKGVTPKLKQRAKGQDTACLLCNRPDVLELIRRWKNGEIDEYGTETGKGKAKEKEKKRGTFQKAAITMFKNTIRGRAKE